MSSVPALVLFDSGVIRSFVSITFSRHISIRHEALSRTFRVCIADEHAVFATDVFQGCVLEIFGVDFLIDQVPIAIGDVCVIVGKDWLSRFRDLIGCERHLVTVQDSSGGVLTIYGESTRSRSTFCSAARARQSLQHRCMGFLAYVVDTQVVKNG